MRCTTTSGRYQCSKTAGHASDCEADDFAHPTIGPYTDTYRSRAYFRGMLDVLGGGDLATVGLRLGLTRRKNEDDCTLRERLWRAGQ